jgi:hypothetical protein
MRYLTLALALALGASPHAQRKPPMAPDTALLVIDIQNF